MKLSERAIDLSAEAAAAQRSFFRLHRAQLALILLAAAVGVLPLGVAGSLNWAGVVAAVLFGASVLLRVLLMHFRDEERWFQARRDAELAKSLCYRYAFGARGFERDAEPRAVLRRLDELCAQLGEPLVRHAGGTHSYSEVSDDMRAARALHLPEARAEYARLRIGDQIDWFTDRALRNRAAARRYLVVMVAAEIVGMLCGILVAVRMAPDALVGLMSAIAAAAIAWSQLRQHSLLAGSYAAQASTLRRLGADLELVDDADWPDFVARVEDTFRTELDVWHGFMGNGR